VYISSCKMIVAFIVVFESTPKNTTLSEPSAPIQESYDRIAGRADDHRSSGGVPKLNSASDAKWPHS
jgi:hypothetical protein